MTHTTITESGQLKLRDKEGNTIVFLHITDTDIPDGVIIEEADLFISMGHASFEHPELMEISYEVQTKSFGWISVTKPVFEEAVASKMNPKTRQIFVRKDLRKLSDKIGHINCDPEALKDPEFVDAVNHMAELAYTKVGKEQVKEEQPFVDFETAYQLEEFRKIQPEHFDENGECYPMYFSKHLAGRMLRLINQMEIEIKKRAKF